MSALTLCDSVEVTVHRYRLTADQLTLQRTPGGVLVKGPGLVAFCPCEATPITVGFSEAKVAPPTDLIIQNAMVRAGGMPVFYAPIIWLRSPNRTGLLTPHLGWRAEDGFWAGSGVHIPLKPSTGTGDEYILNLTAGKYARTGWDLGFQLTTPRTATQFRIDHVGTSFVNVDAMGSQEFDRTSLAWSADVLQGPRARSGFVTAEAASRQSDRSRVEIMHSNGAVVAGAALRWDAWRAATLGSAGLLGPQLRLAAGSSIGELGQVESNTSVFAWRTEKQEASLLSVHSADLAFDARPSALTTRFAMHERIAYAKDESRSLRSSLVGAEGRISAPFVKNWGARAASWSHWIEPFSLVAAAAVTNNLDGGTAAYQTETAQIGLTNIVGRSGTETAYQLELRAGWVSAQARTSAVAVRSRGSGKWFGLGADVILEPNRSWLALSRIRIGDPRFATFALRIEGRTAMSSPQVRWFTDEAWVPWLRAWQSRGGWTSSAESSISPTEWLAVNGGIGSDISAERTMFEFTSIGYRHPCGCLAISAVLSERLGRSGWDAWGMVDLMPH